MEEEDEVAAVTTPEQFKALGHPMRHRLLFALGQGEATISQLAVTLGSNKGNIAHHLRVLADAGLVQPAGTRQVRGGTEQYYRRASRRLSYDDAATIEVAFRALAAEIAAAEPDPFVMLRTLRLTPEHAEQLSAALRDLAGQAEDADDQPRYGLMLGLYQPAHAPSPEPAQPGHTPTRPPAAREPRLRRQAAEQPHDHCTRALCVGTALNCRDEVALPSDPTRT